MAAGPFVHLHCHSHYSLLDGACKIPDLVRHVKAKGMEALAITDHGNLHGAVEFLREAKQAGIKPILGIEAYVAPGRRTDRGLGAGGYGEEKYAFHLTLLARTGEGFRNLMKLSSKSYMEGYYYKPRIDKEILEQYSAGLVCLSGCVGSEFSQHLLNDRIEEAEELAEWYERVFGPENFYIELQNNGLRIQRDCMERAVDLANRKGIPTVATSDAHYLTRDDFLPHDVLVCINTNKLVDQKPDKPRFVADDGNLSDQFFVRGPEQMYEAFPGQEESLQRSWEIACGVEENYQSLELGKRQFPSFEPPGQVTAEEYLRTLCEEGLKDRYGEALPEEARPRLEHELGIISRMGFASYFLIVWDFVRYARENGIPAAARGSACGSLVSYLLKISDVCPIKYDLLFERFLDPSRSEAPDIDIDLCQARRYEVIEYVRRRYGAANVAQIGTFGTLKAKAAIKDVGRALNVPLSRVEEINKLIPSRLNVTVQESIDEEPRLKKLFDEDPDISRLLAFARRLEGMNRSVGTHAAGVVIADRRLEDLVPLQKIKDVVSTQWEMGDLEKAGLLKMDFLGLRNLTTLEATLVLINKRHPESPLSLKDLPLDDPETYALLQRGETRGVFQLESAGIRDLLIKMKPDRFLDIIATIALYRPGPLKGGMVDEYVNVKHARMEATYLHPVMREVLEETYGVMVYQEQIMRILNRLGGIELSKAYAMIKAISKKNKEVIAQACDQFVKGAMAQNLEKDEAAKIFALIEHFGGYGFNKSHSTAYALVAYQTAYLKAHYPTEFMAALLSSEMDGAEREKFFYEHWDDCRRMGIEVLAPNINAGEVTFQVAGPGQIHFGLGAIKGVGVKAVEGILRTREESGAFRTLDDFYERVSAKEVTQGCAETLIRAGAFDVLGARRSQLLAVLPRAIQVGQSRQEDRRRGQRSLFDGLDDLDPEGGSGGGRGGNGKGKKPVVDSNLPEVPELPDAELLAGEKKALGLYMSRHPLARYAELLGAFRSHQVSDLAELPEKTEVVLGGMVTGLKSRNVSGSRSGHTRMLTFNLEDLSGATPAKLWPQAASVYESMLKEDTICFLKGTMDRRREPADVDVSRVIPLERAAVELAKAVVIRLRKGLLETEGLERLQRYIRNRGGGNLDVYLEVVGIPWTRRVVYRAGWSYRLRYDDRLLDELCSIVGAGNARLVGASGSTGPSAEAAPAFASPKPVSRAVKPEDEIEETLEDEEDDL